MKGFVQDILKQLGTGTSSLPQQIVQLGMQGAALVCLCSVVTSPGRESTSCKLLLMSFAVPLQGTFQAATLSCPVWQSRLLPVAEELGNGSWPGVQGGHGGS